MAVLIASVVNAEGHREILGLDQITTEDGGWTTFVRNVLMTHSVEDKLR